MIMISRAKFVHVNFARHTKIHHILNSLNIWYCVFRQIIVFPPQYVMYTFKLMLKTDLQNLNVKDYRFHILKI